MGYYSHFTLTLLGADGSYDNSIDEDEIWSAIEASNFTYALVRDGYGASAKWYSCREDMKTFSKKYPTVLFFIEREGEEAPDFEHMYFLNGAHQSIIGEVVYKEYNPDGFDD